jgi:outer membrane protein TolC
MTPLSILMLAAAAPAAPAAAVPFAPVPAVTKSHDDPRGLIPSAPPRIVAGQAACGEVPPGPLPLPALVDIALCRNPQTAVSWASVRAASAGTGIARAANLPSINVTANPSLNRSDDLSGSNPNGSDTSWNTTAAIALNYLLFDGGGRAARIDAAGARERAAFAQYADAAQEVVLGVITAYNNLAANRAAETAITANVAFARQSRDLAAARQKAGVATPADRLQAETVLAQAELSLIQTRGAVATSKAQLAVAMGLPPQTSLDLAPLPPLATGALLRSGADALIAEAEQLRPDIVAARAAVENADANVRAQLSEGRPSLTATVSNNLNQSNAAFNSNSGAVGLSLQVPLFSGWSQRYGIASARAEADRQRALAEQTRQQAGLAVYANYVALDNALAALGTARTLVASAEESAALAQGRYKAGVGIFADLLNAQSALAEARQQLVTAELNIRTANAQLARAIGGIGEAVDGER